jgi:hypothetical protein
MKVNVYKTVLYKENNFTSFVPGEIGTVISKNSNELKKPDTPPATSDSKIEEEFTVARLYVSKMKSEVKNLVNKSSLLEQSQNDQHSKIENMEKELSDTRLLVGKILSSFSQLSQSLIFPTLFFTIYSIDKRKNQGHIT